MRKAVDSLVYEVEARLRNPTNGFLDFVHNLENWLKEVQQEIDNVKSELTKYLNLEVIQFVMNNLGY
ncbi:LOB domain-containing protein 10-like [Trifolium medium]|uniref:LOB domain-containing protein 10-like n=1 Tax=Trifolium medium TaxID=97028 RepID=A0A392M0X8_9FABA|nr:LOB domain-containing protein 10-like [Trifolium medium]